MELLSESGINALRRYIQLEILPFLLENAVATLAKQIIIFSSLAIFRTRLSTFFQHKGLSVLGNGQGCLTQRPGTCRPAHQPWPVGCLALFPAVIALQARHLSLLQSERWHLPDGWAEVSSLTICWNCQELFTPRLATLSARKQAFPKACQKNTNKNFKRTNFHISNFVLGSCVTSFAEPESMDIFLAQTH